MDKFKQSVQTKWSCIYPSLLAPHDLSQREIGASLLPLPLLVPLSTFVERGIGGEVIIMLNCLTQKESFTYQELWPSNWRRPYFLKWVGGLSYAYASIRKILGKCLLVQRFYGEGDTVGEKK